MRKTIILLLPLLLLLSGCHDERDAKITELTKRVNQLEQRRDEINPKALYELQEQCRKHSEEYFKECYKEPTYRDKAGDYWVASFICHYNKKLNKCFMLLTSTCYPNNPSKDKLGVFTTKQLLDANEYRDYGNYSKGTKSLFMECKVDDKQCSSEEEWDALVKPYMEE